MSTERFIGKHALVTGAGSGIGRAVARRLLDEGARVSAVDIQATRAEVLLSGGSGEETMDRGDRLHFLQADVGDAESAHRAVEAAAEWAGPPEIAINCAGIIRLRPALETAIEDFDEVIRVNLRSVFLIATAVARHLVELKKPGRIVNVSSIHAVVSNPQASAYTAAKGGMEALSRTLASEFASYGITVNCVRPGATRTPMNDNFYSPDVLRALRQRIPLGKIADPGDIAAGICYLASDDARYTTGSVLDIDGGYIMNGALPGATYV